MNAPYLPLPLPSSIRIPPTTTSFHPPPIPRAHTHLVLCLSTPLSSGFATSGTEWRPCSTQTGIVSFFLSLFLYIVLPLHPPSSLPRVFCFFSIMILVRFTCSCVRCVCCREGEWLVGSACVCGIDFHSKYNGASGAQDKQTKENFPPPSHPPSITPFPFLHTLPYFI